VRVVLCFLGSFLGRYWYWYCKGVGTGTGTVGMCVWRVSSCMCVANVKILVGYQFKAKKK
jgi:hypothetical protein